MKSAPQFSKHGPNPLTRLTFFVLLSLLLMAEDIRFKNFPEFRQAIAVLIYPLQKLAHMPVVVYHQVDELISNLHLVKENAFLRKRYLTDQAQLLRLRALEAENSHLRNLLSATKRTETNAVMAEILHVPHDPFNHKTTINKGSQHGIQAGQIVTDELGVIGQITLVYPWAAEVTLITDKDHAVPIQIARNGLRSVISGTGKNDELKLRYLSVNTDVQPNDVLVTSGIGGVYPPGLPVANVSDIERNPGSAFASIMCKPVAGVNRNRHVLILSPIPSIPENPAEISKRTS